MDFIDLKTQQGRIQEKIKTNIQKVLNHGSYILGPEVQDLEETLAKYVGVNHGIACSSGTDALLIALMAYDIKPGDAIFTTPFTFIATAEVIALLGATPIFVDIDPQTYNIDPAKLALAIKALKANDPSIYPLPKVLPSPLAGEGKGEGECLPPRVSSLLICSACWPITKPSRQSLMNTISLSLKTPHNPSAHNIKIKCPVHTEISPVHHSSLQSRWVAMAMAVCASRMMTH